MDVSGFRRALLVCAAGGAALLASGLAPTAALAGATVTTVATGLDNPRGLAFGPNDRLYVGEAGHGGSACTPTKQPPEPGEEPFCVGFTSGISEIGDARAHGHGAGESRKTGVHRIASGLVSFAGQSGFAATGIDGVSAHGNGGVFGIETESIPGLERMAPPLSPPELALARTQVGRLIKANHSGHWKTVADVGSVDFHWSEEHFPEHKVEQPPDANPYGLYTAGGERWITDAAANTLDEVRPDGSVSVVAFIPSPHVSDSVPTCLGRGPDGAFYIGELTGFGNGPGKSVVWRVVPGQEPEEWATGLTAVTGCGFGSDGQFYAAEFSTLGWENAGPENGAETGALVRVPPHSTSPVVIAEKLSFPGGVAAGPDGSIYVSNWSVAPANSGGGPTGEVVRITP